MQSQPQSQPQSRLSSAKPVFLAFFIYSFAFGTLFPRLGDIQIQLGIDKWALGLTLVGLPLGVQLSLLVAGRVLAFMRVRSVMLVGVPIIGFAYFLAALSETPLGFFMCLFLAGMSIGVLEVAVNLEADRTEHVLGTRIMNRAHGFWSLGFFGAALLGGGMAQLGVGVALHFLIFAVACSLACVVAFAAYQQAPIRPPKGAPPLADNKDQTPMFVKPTKPILILVLLTLSAMLVEGTTIDWSVIYMRDTFETAPFVSGLALAFAALFQFITRFFADKFVNQYGPEYVSKISLLCMFFGVLLVVFSPAASAALAGFALMGAGCAVIFPLAMSAAAQQTDRPAAVNVAALAQISFTVFLFAPPLLGYVAEHIDIRMSFAVSLPLIMVSWFSTYALRPNEGAQMREVK